MKITGAIFDVDGTLLDSMKMWSGLGRRFLISCGVFPDDELENEIKNMSIYRFSSFVKDKYNITCDENSIKDNLLKNVSDYYRFEAPLKPGAKDILKYFSEKNIKMCVATAGDKELVCSAFKRLGIIDCFADILTCSDDVNAKESGRIYQKACQLIGCETRNTWVFEDALYAAKAAKKLGFKVAGIYDESEIAKDELELVADEYFINLFDAKEYFV